jgi:uncharacterized protein YggU (UPF0235/DUF167 family)
VRIQVKVVTRASRTEVAGWSGDRLKVRLAAVPERGRANDALEHCVADLLGIGPSRVRVVSGRTATVKMLEISGLDEAEVRSRLPAKPAQ